MIIQEKVALLACFASMSLLIGCESVEPEQSQPAAQPKIMRYTRIDFYSDPPGAYVYLVGPNGPEGDGNTYRGQTSEDKSVGGANGGMILSNRSARCTLDFVFKKRGYKPTTYHVDVPLKYESESEAEQHEQKVVVVLDTE